MQKLLKDKRNPVILLLSALFLIAARQEGARFFFWVLSGILFSVVCDYAISRFIHKKNIFPKSAVISGIILAGIIDYHQPWYLLAVFSFSAIASKHLIKFEKKHIFNPANFGLFLATLFGIPLTWQIESSSLLIIILGIYLAYSLKKIFHILGFIFLFTILFASIKINPFGLISWFFIFIMLIEPKTSGYGALRGFIFGGIAAISSFLIFKFIAGYDLFISALLIANLSNPALEKIIPKRK